MAAAIAGAENANIFSIEDALILCGVSQTPGVVAVDRKSDAERMANEIFSNQFESCKDMSYKDITDDLKTYSTLTVNEGRIRLMVRMKKNIRALLQWVKDEFRYGRNPGMTEFPVADVENLIRRSKTFDLFVEKSSSLSSNAKPDKLKVTTEWNDWKPTFVNYLRLLPG